MCACVCVFLGVGSFTIVDGQTVTAEDAGNKLVTIMLRLPRLAFILLYWDDYLFIYLLLYLFIMKFVLKVQYKNTV